MMIQSTRPAVATLPLGFEEQLFAVLRAMDQEATTEADELPTGLRWYSAHEYAIHPLRRRKKSDDERAWCRRLNELLPLMPGIEQVVVDQPYPAARTFCDLRIRYSTGAVLWAEVKGAWTYLWNYPNLTPNTPYRKHLLTDPRECAVKDFDKLRQLGSTSATHIGMLLVGFDTEHLDRFRITDDHISQLRELTGVRREGWHEAYRVWDDEHQQAVSVRKTEGFRARCWLWYRPVITTAPLAVAVPGATV